MDGAVSPMAGCAPMANGAGQNSRSMAVALAVAVSRCSLSWIFIVFFIVVRATRIMAWC